MNVCIVLIKYCLCLCLTHDRTKQAVSGRLDYTIRHAGKFNKEDKMISCLDLSHLEYICLIFYVVKKTQNMKKTSIFNSC